MKRSVIIEILTLVVLIVLLLTISEQSKHIFLYAWERPEDFSFLKNVPERSRPTIIVFSGAISVRRDGLSFSQRSNPLKLPEGTRVIPLIRIDSYVSSASFASYLDSIAQLVVRVCGGSAECQLDFDDARPSDFERYGALIERIAAEIPETSLKMTALATWCGGQSWLDSLPVAKAIPMLYRMGIGSRAIKAGDVPSGFLSNAKCRGVRAVAMDELDFDVQRYGNDSTEWYAFNPRPWTRTDYDKLLSALR